MHRLLRQALVELAACERKGPFRAQCRPEKRNGPARPKGSEGAALRSVLALKGSQVWPRTGPIFVPPWDNMVGPQGV